jgi:hypothetical protein
VHTVPSARTRRGARHREDGTRSGARPRRARPRRWIAAVLAACLGVFLLPVPWLHVVSDDPPGTAWRLDGRLHVDGAPVDPPGRWTWLAVGRLPLVGELLYDELVGRGSDDPPEDMRRGAVTRRPSLNEPAAAAVGLRHAGRDIRLGLLVEVRDPLLAGYPDAAEIAAVNGVAVTDREAWQQVSSGWDASAAIAAGASSDAGTGRGSGAEVTFLLRDGRRFTAPGPGLPYGTIHTLDLAPEGLEAGITFKLARLLPGDWFRNLSLGRSHGMIVALTTYAHASERDLAQGRHIAGTGGIRGDGRVTRVGGVPAKARAANRAGADVLFVPASQLHQLDDVPLPGTTVVPITTLDEAIDWLATPRA